MALTHWSLRKSGCNYDCMILKHISVTDIWIIYCETTLLNGTGPHWWISQHWLRQWLGAVRLQAIIWTNVDRVLWRHMVSLGHNELITPVELEGQPSPIVSEPHILKLSSLWDPFQHYCTNKRPQSSSHRQAHAFCSCHKILKHPEINTVKNYFIILVQLMLP